MAKKKARRGKKKSCKNGKQSYSRDIGFLSKCKTSKKRSAFLRKCPHRLALQNTVQRGCSKILQQGGQLKANLRSKLARRRLLLNKGARSKKGAYQILQKGGSFLSDLWSGVKDLLGM
jgi:hypothetical protein